VELDSDLPAELALFHEGPSRILISTAEPGRVSEIAERHRIPAPSIGITVKGRLDVRRAGSILISTPIEVLQSTFEGSLAHQLGA
jgi:phosphoribosylformylglycinamidine synthase